MIHAADLRASDLCWLKGIRGTSMARLLRQLTLGRGCGRP
jgi:hypothetical protein